MLHSIARHERLRARACLHSLSHAPATAVLRIARVACVVPIRDAKAAIAISESQPMAASLPIGLYGRSIGDLCPQCPRRG
jgi:hypothetical protein